MAGDELLYSEELNFAGASRDLTHDLFSIEASSEVELTGHHNVNDLWRGDTTHSVGYSLYEYANAGSYEREPVLVGVRNDGRLQGEPYVNKGAALISDCGTELGSDLIDRATLTKGSVYNAVSSSGEVVFFTSLACAGGPEVNEIYARVTGEHTVAISEPILNPGECDAGEPCNGAAEKEGIFQGASENGEWVFFLSEQPLVNGALSEGMKLYKERLENGAVAEVKDISNEGSAGINPEVQGVVRVSETGERVYFVAKGQLAGSDRILGREPEEAGPELGTDNLYVNEPDTGHPGTYHTVFVVGLLAPDEEASLAEAEKGEVEEIELQGFFVYEAEALVIEREFEFGKITEHDMFLLLEEAINELVKFVDKNIGARGPSGTLREDESVWQHEDDRPAQATRNGEDLVFVSSARLTGTDESTVPQLFEYEAVGESLTRVSFGHGGPSTGNVDTFKEAPSIPAPPYFATDLPTAPDTGLAMSADGSRVFFTSAASLAPRVEANSTNVYEYSDGAVYLISGGNDTSSYTGQPTLALLGTDPSGRDVFFMTSSQLVPEDGETQMVLYDAREEGGFPAKTPSPGCADEACRGTSGTLPQFSMAGSANQAGGGNFVPTTSPPPVVKPEARACRKGLVRKRGKCVRRHGPRRPRARKADKLRGTGR